MNTQTKVMSILLALVYVLVFVMALILRDACGAFQVMGPFFRGFYLALIIGTVVAEVLEEGWKYVFKSPVLYTALPLIIYFIGGCIDFFANDVTYIIGEKFCVVGLNLSVVAAILWCGFIMVKMIKKIIRRRKGLLQE